MTLNNELSDIVKDVSTNLAKIGHHAWLPKRFAYDDLLHCDRFGPHTQTTDGMKFYQNNFALLQGIVCASSIIFFPDTLPSISQYVKSLTFIISPSTMFDHRLLTTNPVLLGSFLLLTIGWVVAFCGLCVSQGLVFNLSWWFIIYQFMIMMFVFTVIITASIAQYRLVILAFISLSLSYCTGEISKYLHSELSTSAAITTGYIFITIVQFLWVFVFGSTEDSRFGSVIDNLTLHAQPMPTATVAAPAMVQTNTYTSSPYSPPQYNTSQTTLPQQQSIKHASYISNSNHSSPNVESTVVVSPHADYPLDVVALHSYDANPDDPNELSFAKGDVLHVHDNRGNWWQARKADGSVGIVPSNYFAKD